MKLANLNLLTSLIRAAYALPQWGYGRPARKEVSMTEPSPQDITQMLIDWSNGKPVIIRPVREQTIKTEHISVEALVGQG